MKQKLKPFFVYPPVGMLALYITVLGYMIPAIRDAFSLSLTEAGLLSTLQSVGTALSVVLCISVFSTLNKTRILAISSFLLSTTIILVGINSVVFILYTLFFFIGLFNNIVDTLSNAILADLAPEKKGFHIGLLQALWAAAGIFGPFFALMLGGAYSPVFFGLGALTAVVSIIYTIGLRQEIKAPMSVMSQSGTSLRRLFDTFRIKGTKLFILISFSNAMVQMSMIFFISTHVSGLTGNSMDGALALSMTFVGTLLGRVVYATYLHKQPARRTLPFMNLVSLIAYTILLLSSDLTLICVLAVLGGFGIAPNFPAFIVELCNIVPDNTASASSLIFLGYTIACFVTPPLVGAIGDAAGLNVALQVVSLILIPVIVLSSRLGARPAAKVAKRQ